MDRYPVFALMVKNLPAIAGDTRDVSLIPQSGRSPGGGNGKPLWYSCLEMPMDIFTIVLSSSWINPLIIM